VKGRAKDRPLPIHRRRESRPGPLDWAEDATTDTLEALLNWAEHTATGTLKGRVERPHEQNRRLAETILESLPAARALAAALRGTRRHQLAEFAWLVLATGDLVADLEHGAAAGAGAAKIHGGRKGAARRHGPPDHSKLIGWARAEAARGADPRRLVSRAITARKTALGERQAREVLKAAGVPVGRVKRK
jgi:hypothetical protein